MTVPLVQVDAFADRPFAGNPAAVCLLEGPADEAWMQAVAAEMNSRRPPSSTATARVTRCGGSRRSPRSPSGHAT